ncbi:MAG: hypothetical protein PHG24_01150 [Candidatus Pacebacteria bacterium]|nr:hypothetical protein [Candidatus Paceibacterota bacterium]
MKEKECKCAKKLSDSIEKNDPFLALEALEKMGNCMCQKPEKVVLSVAYEIIIESRNQTLIEALKKIIGFDPEIFQKVELGVI